MTIWLGLDAAEYILIPGGKYRFSVTGEEVTVPNLYFAKYPVTNKRYRILIAYLLEEKRMSDVLQLLPVETFAQSLLAGENEIKGYLGEDHSQWAQKLVSVYDDDKRFNGDDKPVVGVTWYAAMAYCHWHTMLQRVVADRRLIYRLPAEEEWEWAAGGGQRKYPWGNEKPDETRANYDLKVRQTTPVGVYPAGATPEGLQDMAGNVLEWMKNLYGKGAYWKDARALRGGSWLSNPEYLRCVARYLSSPDNQWNDNGFRVVCAREV